MTTFSARRSVMPVLQNISSVSSLQTSIGNRVLLTRDECAEILRIHVRTLDALLKDGVIHFKRVGRPLRGRVLVPLAEVERFLQMEEPANSR
jgi:excisionase family DNA binding protein